MENFRRVNFSIYGEINIFEIQSKIIDTASYLGVDRIYLR